MSLLESLRLAMAQIRAHKLKSFLTLLGVIIGVMFLVAVIAVVEGVNRFVQDDFAGSIFGVNTLQVHRRQTVAVGPEDAERRRLQQRNPDLTVDDARVLAERVPGIWYIAHSSDRGLAEISSGPNVRRNVRLIGAPPDYLPLQGWEVVEGRGLNSIDDARAIRVAVIGDAIATRLFPDGPAIGGELRLGPRRYRVVGVLRRQGGLIGNIRDAAVVVPWGAYQADFAPRRGTVEEVAIKFRSEREMEAGHSAIEEVLRQRHGLRPGQENDFAIESASEILDVWQKINAVLFAALPGLVSIALVVGGIVIMNIMLMAVLERTREIGIRKALGARSVDIRRQFLAESATLAGVGAVVGVLIGAGFAQLVRALTPLPVQIALWSVVVSIALGLIVGVFAGAYPAARAARLDPVTALRYE